MRSFIITAAVAALAVVCAGTALATPRSGQISKAQAKRYVVVDWRQHHLKPPPRGYHYVRSENGDFLLASIKTGAVLSIVTASH